MHGLTFDSSSNKQLHQCQLVQFLFVVVYKFPSLMCKGNQNNTKKKNPYCVLLISLLDMQNNVLSAVSCPTILGGETFVLFRSFSERKASGTTVKTRECHAPRARQTISFDSWPVAKLSDSKTTQNKNIKNNYLEYLFAQQNATNNNRKTVHNDHFFRNKSKQKNKQNRKKRKPNRLGSDFLKKQYTNA